MKRARAGIDTRRAAGITSSAKRLLQSDFYRATAIEKPLPRSCQVLRRGDRQFFPDRRVARGAPLALHAPALLKARGGQVHRPAPVIGVDRIDRVHERLLARVGRPAEEIRLFWCFRRQVVAGHAGFLVGIAFAVDRLDGRAGHGRQAGRVTGRCRELPPVWPV